MKTKPSGGSRRYSGHGGRERLIAALSDQSLVAGDPELAKRFAQKVTIKTIAGGKDLVTQGEITTDLLLLLRGSVGVFVNGREIGERRAGEHVGEMALLDTYQVRSATVRTMEDTVVARISEYDFTKLGKLYPQLWRRVAVTLSERLRERAKFFPAPRAQPAIFIGSSSEGLPFAECIYRTLKRLPVVPHLWSEGVFEASKTTIEELVREASESDFAILILSEDDATVSRGRRRTSPRDNVLFELGLFMGAVGRERTYVLAPQSTDLKIPTDLLGLTFIRYAKTRSALLARRNRSAMRALRKLIEKYGPR
jgi:CRP/FNR family cyclic AMP-dependent transcriptional regulator